MARIKSDEEKKNEKAAYELETMLYQRGADRRNPSKWLAKRVGISETTARKYINHSSTMPMGVLRELKINADEIARLI